MVDISKEGALAKFLGFKNPRTEVGNGLKAPPLIKKLSAIDLLEKRNVVFFLMECNWIYHIYSKTGPILRRS